MRSPDQLLSFLQLLLEPLEPYLLSDEIFWPLDPGAGLRGDVASRLSLGALALTLDQLAAIDEDLSPDRRAQRLRLERRWEACRVKWRVAIERKSALETRARLRLWSAYLDDLEENRGASEDYAHEVRQRVMAARVAAWSGPGPDAERNLELAQALDQRLRALFVAGAFVWEKQLAPVFPAPEFWFLYGRPSGRPDGYLA